MTEPRRPRRILVTNVAMRSRAGTEMYIRDLSTGLLRNGYQVVIYTTRTGEMAEELRRLTVPVVEDLGDLGFVPDLIHGHHALETMTALLRFPDVPAVFVCHDWSAWTDRPPKFPRILRYVAVDDTCRDRLQCENGVPEDKTRVIYNFVDLDRFTARNALPQRPRRALVFSNYASRDQQADIIVRACRERGIEVDFAGKRSGRPIADPESVLHGYDLVFAKAKAAIEAMATGAAVILCDRAAAGPLVTTAGFDRLRRLNFGRRALSEPVSVAHILREIDRFDAADATRVCELLRNSASAADAVADWIELYDEVLEEHQNSGAAADPRTELAAVAEFLATLGRDLRADRTAAGRRDSLSGRLLSCLRRPLGRE